MAYNYDELLKSYKERLSAKVEALEADEADEAQGKNVYRLGSFSEIGLRRRLSSEAQELAVKTLAEADYNGNSLFVGTSNVYLAKK